VILAAQRAAEVPGLVLAATGALVLAFLARRHRAGRPLLHAVERPFRPARAGALLFLAAGLFLAYQLGRLLVVSGDRVGALLGTALPLALSAYAARLARRDVLLPRGSRAWLVGMGLLHVWASLPLVFGTFFVARALGLPEQPQVVSIRERAAGWELVAFSAVVVAPFAEEVCFRGLVYPALRQRLPFRDAALFSSLAFAFVHPPTVWAPMAILALFLAWLAERTGSIVPCVAGHMAFNATSVAQMLLLPA
jgi:membrane protease YdiL (CAAX protease family)